MRIFCPAISRPYLSSVGLLPSPPPTPEVGRVAPCRRAPVSSVDVCWSWRPTRRRAERGLAVRRGRNELLAIRYTRFSSQTPTPRRPRRSNLHILSDGRTPGKSVQGGSPYAPLHDRPGQ